LPQASDFARNLAALKGLVLKTCPNKDLLNSATTRQSTVKPGGCDAAALTVQNTIGSSKSHGARKAHGRVCRANLLNRIQGKIAIQAEII
jgi:hypothetical protein